MGALTAFVLIIRLLDHFTRSDEQLMKNSAIHKLCYVFIWLLSIVVFVYSAATVSGLRSWVSKSGWLQPIEKSNPEYAIRGFGQTAALVLVAAMLISALENASIVVQRAVKNKKLPKAKRGKGKHHV